MTDLFRSASHSPECTVMTVWTPLYIVVANPDDPSQQMKFDFTEFGVAFYQLVMAMGGVGAVGSLGQAHIDQNDIPSHPTILHDKEHLRSSMQSV